ncbi:phage tail protein [Fulvitalea axinellae]
MERQVEGEVLIRMPLMSDAMEYGIITKWHVKVGDVIKADDILAEVETEKATMELESHVDGIVQELSPEGERVAVDEVIARLGLLDESTTEEFNALGPNMKGTVGEVRMFAGDKIPRHWLKCDGSLYKVEEKEELFSIIGNKYGEGENSFRVPKIDPIGGVMFIICAR